MSPFNLRRWKYVLDGHEPVPEDDILVWGRWFETADRRVALTELPSGHVVSTVSLGIDHNFYGGTPLLFETMAGGDGDFLDIQRRCSTWSEAEAQHEEVVMELTQQYADMHRRFRERR